MASNTTKLGVSISGEMSDIKAALAALRRDLAGVGTAGRKAGSDASNGLDGIRAGAGRLKGLLGGLFAGLSFGSLFAAVIENTRESEEAIGQLNAALTSTKGIVGVTSDEIVELAGSLQQVTTFGDDAIIRMTSLLATFTNVRGAVFKDAVPAILDLSTRLGTDLNSAAIQVGKALNDPARGIAALAKAGIQLSPIQKQQIEDFLKLGDVAGAQGIILGELSTQMGGSARAAADTFSGAITQAKNAVGDLLEGDSSSGGLKDAKSAIQDLAQTLNDPEVKDGFAVIVAGIASIAKNAALAISSVVGLGKAVNEAFAANAKKSYDGLLLKQAALKDDLADLEKTGAVRLNLLLGGRSGSVNPLSVALSGSKDQAAKLKEELAQVTALLRTMRGESDGLNRGRGGGRSASASATAPFDKTQEQIDAEKDAAKERAAAAKKQTEELKRELEKRLKLSQDADEADRQRKIKIEERASEGLQQVGIALDRAAGREAEAAFKEIELKYEQLIKDLLESGDVAGAELVKKLISVEKIEAQIEVFKATANDALGGLQSAETSLSAQVEGGLLGQAEAETQIAAKRESTLQTLTQLREAVAAYYETTKDESVLAYLQELDGDIGKVAASQQMLVQQIADTAIGSLTNFLTDIATGAKTGKEALVDFVRSFVAGMAQLAAKAVATALVLRALEAISPGITKILGIFASVKHAGGMVGAPGGRTRSGVNPALFGAAPRYHNGGIAGLGPNEVPIIAEKGEEILAKADPRNARNAGKGGRGAGAVKNVILFDANTVADHMVTKPGEEALLQVVGNNAGAIRGLLGV